MRRQPCPHSGYSPGTPGTMGPAKLSLDGWHTETGRKRSTDYKVCGGFQETSTATALRFLSWNCSRATVGVWLESVFSTEGRHHLSCKETDRKCCCGSHPTEMTFSPRRRKVRLWAWRKTCGTSHSVHLRITDSISRRDIQVSISSPLPSPLSLRVAPEKELQVEPKSSDTHMHILSTVWTHPLSQGMFSLPGPQSL